MAYCRKCGQELSEGMRYCTACGADSLDDGNGKKREGVDYEQVLGVEDHTSRFDSVDIQKNKAYAVLAYLGFLVFVPLLAARKSPFARYHTEQGLLLFILSAAKGVAVRLLYELSYRMFFEAFSVVIHVLDWAVGIMLLVLAVFGIVQAVQGKAKELPLIGKWKLFHL